MNDLDWMHAERCRRAVVQHFGYLDWDEYMIQLADMCRVRHGLETHGRWEIRSSF